MYKRQIPNILFFLSASNARINIKKYEINEKAKIGETNSDDVFETILTNKMNKIEIAKACLLLFFIIFFNTSIIVNSICN